LLSAIDHVVLAVSNLEDASQALREAGFDVVPGGRHPVGTENALVPFADGTYIEVLGFREPNASHRWWPLLQRGGGVVDICGTSDDLADDVAAFRKAGIPYSDPRELGRVRHDGHQLRFAVANPTEDIGVINFLCQDHTPRSERVPAGRPHPNGAKGLQRVLVAVPDLAKARKCYEQVLGKLGREVERRELGARGVEFAIGRQKIEYLVPTREDGEIGHWLKQRGPSVYAAMLEVEGGKPIGVVEGANGARLLAVLA